MNDRSRGEGAGWFEGGAYPGGGDHPDPSARHGRRRRRPERENGGAPGAPCTGRQDTDHLIATPVLPTARPGTASPRFGRDKDRERDRRPPAPARPHSAAGVMGRRSGGGVPLHMAGAGTKWSREIIERTAALPRPRPRPGRQAGGGALSGNGQNRACSGGTPHPARGTVGSGPRRGIFSLVLQ